MTDVKRIKGKMENLLRNQREIFSHKFINLLFSEEICEETMELASINCGLDKHHHKLLFQGGLVELLSFLSQLNDDIMLEKLSHIINPTSVTQKIAIATKIRVKLLDRIILQKIFNFYINPLHTKNSIKLGFKTCDSIWKYSGDRSADYNYYSKRILLASVYLPSLLYYLGDDSENFESTDLFIQSSLEKIVRIAGLKKKIKLPKIENIPILRMFL